MLNDMVDKTLTVKAIEQSVRQKLSYFARKIPPMEVIHKNTITINNSTVPCDIFNNVFGGRSNQSLFKDDVKMVKHYFYSRNFPMQWWFCSMSSMEKNNSILEDAGFLYDQSCVGMAMELDYLPEVRLSQDLTIKAVTLNDQGIMDFAEVYASIFDPFDLNIISYYKLLANSKVSHQEIVFLVGYHNERAVVSGSCFFSGEVVGIYDIATHPQARKKGFATSITYRLLKIARDRGYSSAVLQASEAGVPIYKKLGFLSFCDFHLFNNRSMLK